MLGKIVGGLKTVFGFDGVANSATKIIDKIAGTDWTPKEKAEFLLKYQDVTKHQSPTRRIIAITILFEWFILVNVWVVLTLLGVSEKAKEISDFMNSNINIMMNAVVSFYLLMQVVKK